MENHIWFRLVIFWGGVGVAMVLVQCVCVCVCVFFVLCFGCSQNCGCLFYSDLTREYGVLGHSVAQLHIDCKETSLLLMQISLLLKWSRCLSTFRRSRCGSRVRSFRCSRLRQGFLGECMYLYSIYSDLKGVPM